MDPLLKKMNYRDEPEILIIGLPDELVTRFSEFQETVKCFKAYEAVSTISFAIVFVLNEKEVDEASESMKHKLTEDCKLWFCYPKKSSKRYKSEINRDNGWNALGALGFEPVRQVAVNEDFSALRFRRVEKIKTITRSKEMAMTDEAKARTRNGTAKKKE